MCCSSLFPVVEGVALGVVGRRLVSYFSQAIVEIRLCWCDKLAALVDVLLLYN
jgi:hypothetical protein